VKVGTIECHSFTCRHYLFVKVNGSKLVNFFNDKFVLFWDFFEEETWKRMYFQCKMCIFRKKIVTYTKSKNWEKKWLPVQMSCLVIYSHKSTVNNESNINHVSSLVHLTFKGIVFAHFQIYHM